MGVPSWLSGSFFFVTPFFKYFLPANVALGSPLPIGLLISWQGFSFPSWFSPGFFLWEDPPAPFAPITGLLGVLAPPPARACSSPFLHPPLLLSFFQDHQIGGENVVL